MALTLDGVAREREKSSRPMPKSEFTATVNAEQARKAEATGDKGQTNDLLTWALKVPEPKVGMLDFDAFPFQVEMYKVLGGAYRDVVIRKGTQVGACLDPDTPVLTADLRWVPIASIRPGDELVACDEFAPGGKGNGRKLRRATVEACSVVEKPAVKLTFKDGRSVVATAEHRLLWMTAKGEGAALGRAWREVGKMRVGEFIREIVPPWSDEPLGWDDAWLSGIIDGEGSLRGGQTRDQPGAELVISQQEASPVFDRIRDYLDAGGYCYRVDLNRAAKGGPVGRAVIERIPELMRLIGRTRPTRFTNGDWWESCGLPLSRGWAEIVAIEQLEPQTMIDLQTTTGTYVANGFVSHNSSMLVRWAIHQSDMNGRTVMYVFPTAGDVYDWGDTRITPLFDQEYLSQRKGEPFNKGLKAVGSGFVFFRGSESKRKLDSVDADAIALDEYDTLNQRNIPDAERRLSGPLSAGLIRRIGVPSLPEYGISERYDESDRRKWLVRCENAKCKTFRGRDREAGDIPLRVPDKRGGWQEIDFWRNVKWDETANGKVVLNARRVCENCGDPLDVAEGRWVAQQPESPIPGFHISRLIAPGARMDEIVRASKRTTPYEVEVFYNKDLGLPYVSKTARLSAEEINAARRGFDMVAGYAGPGTVTMGVDVASERALNVRISLHLDEERKKALWIGEVEDHPVEGLAFDQLAKLMVRFNVSMCGIDALPESRLARQLATRFPGRVYLVRLTGHATKQVISVDDELGEVVVKRTEALDATVEMIRSQRNLLPHVLPEKYVPHLTANIRKIVKAEKKGEETGEVNVTWVPTRPDDYAMSELFDMVATELFYRRVLLGEATKPVEVPLDEVQPFTRSRVNEYGEAADEYVAGPGGLHFGDGRPTDPMWEDV